MNPSFFYLKRKAVALEPELQATIDRIALNGWNTYPELQKAAVNNWIIRTKLNGNVFNSRTHIYLRGLGTSTESLMQASKINLKNPNGDLAIVSGGVTLTPNGYLYGGVNGYANNRFKPSSISNIGTLYDIMDDFTTNGNGLFGVQQNSPSRRLGMFPKNGGGPGNNQSGVYVNDFTLNGVAAISNNRTIAIGRNATEKYAQINNTRFTFATAAITPLITLEDYSGATNNNGTGAFFCAGTERIYMAGGAMTEAEVNQQIIINNQYYTELGLPLNS